ncbi:PIN domain-containing protein [Dankookia sp. GCM10030260]|uniref:PIN domain-containing protein n=1 Tax=Dankookia sp. GCM10030260 TaxID=3273390 RepID=UPI00360B20AC
MTSDPASAGIAVLDACVLFRGRLTDLLLRLAEAGLFDPAWSAAIAAEWMRGLQRRRGIAREVVEARQRLLDRAFPGATCEPDAARTEAVLALCRSAAQRKDAHVVATALAAEARWIVTDNTADFPRRLLAPLGLRALRPDAFCAELLALDPARALAAAAAHRARLPPGADHPALLADRRMSLPRTARWLAGQGRQHQAGNGM